MVLLLFRLFLISGFGGIFLFGQIDMPLSVVSSASYNPVASPDSHATIFGKGLAQTTKSAELDHEGQFPLSVEGTTVKVDGKDARIVYVSPGQVNFLVPSEVTPGNHTVEVISPAASGKLTGSLRIEQVSPGIFTIPCLRQDRAAVLNGVTFSLEPFSAVTLQNPIDDKRTRISIFGTGIRHAGLVSASVEVELTDRWGFVHLLEVEYAGPAPVYFGLDQINAVIPAKLEGAGVAQLQVRIGEKKSNSTSIVLSRTLAAGLGASNNFGVRTIAGTGEAGHSGDGSSATSAKLHTPVAVAIDHLNNIYLASRTLSVVRRISSRGIITTIAGTGTAGFSGDSGPATGAQLNQPSGIAVDRAGNIFIADTGNHRIRRIDSSGVISTVAGNGSSGFGGDNGPAHIAQLSYPAGLAVNSGGTLYLADSGNHRIRKITPDGRIHTFAGTGVSGSSGDGNAALLARLNLPDGITVGENGTIWIADSGNRRIRQVAPDGTIRTLAGGGDGDLAPGISLLDPLHLHVDDDHRLFVADTPSAYVRSLDGSCQISHVIGTGTAGFSADGYPASGSQVNQPAGIIADISGDLYFADSGNHRIRHLYRGEDQCDQPGGIFFDFSSPQAGATVFATMRLNCPVSQETTFTLSGEPNGLSLPGSFVIPAGQHAGVFAFSLPVVTQPTVFTVTASGGSYTATGTVSVYPLPGNEAGWLTFSPSVQRSGYPVIGTLKLRNAAPAGGIQATLSSSHQSAQVANTVTVPEGNHAAEFLVVTTAVNERTNVTITAEFGSNRISGALAIARANQGNISGISLTAGSVVGGESLTGGVILTTPAPEGGVEVELSSNHPIATVPARITVPQGQSSTRFTILTQAVSTSVDVLLTATSATTASTSLTVTPSGAGSDGQIESVALASTGLIGGQGTTGTVRLSAPAAIGGVAVRLTSNHPAVSVPPALLIPQGDMTGMFAITSSTTTTPITASITAASANSRSVDLMIQPGTGNTVNLGALVLAPNPANGGQSVTGTISLSTPAPAGGVHISLSSSHPSASVPSSASAAAGQTTAAFTITTSSSITSPVAATISASSGNTVSEVLSLNPPQPVQASIAGVSLASSMVVGGQSTNGTITLDAAAPVGGVRVSLNSSNGSVDVDTSIIIPAGSLTASFSVTTSSVSTVATAVITVSSQNSRTATLTINPITGGLGSIGSITLDSSTLVAGNMTQGTVALVAPPAAGSGGVQVVLSSSHPGVVVPGSITIQEGQTINTFPVTTSSPAPGSPVTITATSANSVATTLTVNAPQPVQATLSGISLNPSTVVENGSVSGTVTLAAAAPGGGVRVDLMSSNGSVAAVAAPTFIIIPAGSSSGTFTVTTSNVTATTSVVISAQSANSQTATLTVNPIAGATVTIGSLSISPNPVSGGGTASGTVILAAPAPSGGVSIPLSSNHASVQIPANLTIAAGSSSGTFSISVSHIASPITALITATSANSQSQSLVVNPAAPGAASIQGVTLGVSALIGGGSTSGTVTLTAPAPPNGISVSISSNNSSALPGSTPIVIAGGSTTGTFSIQTSTVSNSVNVTITATSANSSTASLTVHPPSGPQVSIGSITLAHPTLTSGGSTTGTVMLAAPAPVTGVTISLSSNHGSTIVPPSVTISPGQNSATFAVTTTPVSSITNVTISAQSANTVNAALTLNPPPPQQVSLNGVNLAASTLEGGQGTTGTVTLTNSAPAGGATVAIASNHGNVSVTTPVLIPAGQTTGGFTVSTSSIGSSASVTITATSANTVSTNLNLTPTGPSSGNIAGLTISANTLTGGASTTGTVTLAATAPIGGVTVALSSNHPAASIVPTTLTIPQGQITRNFAVNTTAVSSAANITITAQSANSRTANLSLNPPCVESLTLSVGSIIGGGNLNATVRLTGPAPAGGAAVQLLAVSGGAGFNNLPSSILIPEGQVEATVQLVTNPVAALLSAVLQAVFGPCPGVTASLNIQLPILNGLSVPAEIKLFQSGTGTVTISGPAPTGGKVVSLAVLTSLPFGLNLGVPASVTIPAGQTSATFQINVLGSLLGALNINIQASLDGVDIVRSILLSLL